MEHLGGTTVTSQCIKNWTKQGPLLSKLLYFVVDGL